MGAESGRPGWQGAGLVGATDLMAYEDALATITAPGQAYETGELSVGGVTYTVFKRAPENMRDLIAPARELGSRPFLVYEDMRMTYEEVLAQAEDLGRMLLGQGIAPGDHVGLAMRNYPEWVVTYFALISIGAVAVLFNTWWIEGEIAYALQDSGAAVLIADEETADRAAAECRRRSIPLVALRGGTDDLESRIQRWKEASPAAAAPLPAIDPEQDVTIVYTSGTTGHPKGVVATHRSLVQAMTAFQCRQAADELRFGTIAGASVPELSTLLAVPLFHSSGCISVLLNHLLAGSKVTLMYRWDPARALELIEQEQVTHFFGVPTMCHDLLNAARGASNDTSSLQCVSTGGAPTPPATARELAERFEGLSPATGYGMTETNAYGTQHGGPEYLERPSSVGKSTPIVEIEIRDEAGLALPTGESGEIWFKGPHLMRCYWGQPEASAEVLKEGWLRTGDVGRLDHEGFLYVEDRVKDMVLRGGENIASAEVESALHEHPRVLEAAVFGIPHDRLGEEVAAVVHVASEAPVSASELQTFVAERLATFKVPSVVWLTEANLPRGDTGKVRKRDLRESVVNRREKES